VGAAQKWPKVEERKRYEMSDPNANTSDLTVDEKLDQVLRKLSDLDAKVATLESQGTGTTRPLLDRILKEMIETRETLTERIAALEQESKTIRREMGLLREDIRGERLHRAELAERVEELERRPN
jgi:low affinity Fe/Cu permease